jgi:hypothetical protein
MRITVFHGNKQDFVQAVICSDKLDYFKELGFVDSHDKLPSVDGDVEKESAILYYKDKIKKLGGTVSGNAKLETLKATYSKLKAKSNGDNKKD